MPKTKKTKKLGAVAIKHKAVLEKIEENMGKPGKKGTVEEAMKECGYSESYARNGQLKDTRTWDQLMEEYLPDAEIAKHHKQLLHMSRVDHFPYSRAIPDEEIIELIREIGCEPKRIAHGDTANQIWYFAPDAIAKKNALDMAYKLKKRYDNTITLKGKLSTASDEEIEERIAGILSGIIGSLAGKGEEGK